MNSWIWKYLFVISTLTAVTASWGRDPVISLAGECGALSTTGENLMNSEIDLVKQ